MGALVITLRCHCMEMWFAVLIASLSLDVMSAGGKTCQTQEGTRYFGHYDERWIGNGLDGYWPTVSGNSPTPVKAHVDTAFSKACRELCEKSVGCFSWTYWKARSGIGGHCYLFHHNAVKKYDTSFSGGECSLPALFWMAVAPGVYRTDEGVVFEIGTAASTTGHIHAKFSADFGSNPIVVVPMVQRSQLPWVVPRVVRITRSGFAVFVQSTGFQAAEGPNSIGFLAIPAGSGTIGGHAYHALAIPYDLSEQPRRYMFREQANPIVFGGISRHGHDPATLLMSDLSHSSVKLRVREPEECGWDGIHPRRERGSLFVVDWNTLSSRSATQPHVILGSDGKPDFPQPFNKTPVLFAAVVSSTSSNEDGQSLVARVVSVTRTGARLGFQSAQHCLGGQRHGKHQQKYRHGFAEQRGQSSNARGQLKDSALSEYKPLNNRLLALIAFLLGIAVLIISVVLCFVVQKQRQQIRKLQQQIEPQSVIIGVPAVNSNDLEAVQGRVVIGAQPISSVASKPS